MTCKTDGLFQWSWGAMDNHGFFGASMRRWLREVGFGVRKMGGVAKHLQDAVERAIGYGLREMTTLG